MLDHFTGNAGVRFRGRDCSSGFDIFADGLAMVFVSLTYLTGSKFSREGLPEGLNKSEDQAPSV